MLITPRQPFDFARTLRFVLSPPALANGRSFEPLLDYFVDGEYRRVADISGQPVLYAVREDGRGERSALSVRTLAGPPGHGAEERIKPVVADLVRRQFATELDLGPFYRLAGQDPVIATLVGRFAGMRIPQAPTVFETVACAVLEQQVNLTFAHQVKKALIETYGTHVEFEGRRYNAFPEPAALAITTLRELRRLQISGPKARYIIAIACATLDGAIDLEGLRTVEPEAARGKLLDLKGVGPWTAQYVGLRALGHLDCLPAADVGLQKSIRLFYGLRKQPTAARVEQIAKAWTGWRSYGTFYLWLTYWEDAAWKSQVVEQLRLARQRHRA